MICNSLPKSYLIKQRRAQLTSICHGTPTPGKSLCAQLCFTELLKERINYLIDTNKDIDRSSQPIEVKLSGDVARMTRNSSCIFLSFSLLQTGNYVMSASGNPTIAIVKEPENYDTINNEFQDSFREINDSIAQKDITIGNSNLNLDFFLRGDFKFLLLMMGMKSSTSNYECIWCKTHKENRWEMDFDLHHFNTAPLRRTHQ